MQLIGFGDFHYIDGSAEIAARFRKDDGGIFDLPISEDQLKMLATEMQDGGREASVTPMPAPTMPVPKTQSQTKVAAPERAKAPASLLDDEVEDDENAPIRLFSSSGEDDE